MLTGKQEGFAQDVARGKTLAEAYRANYDVKAMHQASVYQQASKLMDHAGVAARVKELVDGKADSLMMADRVRVRQYVFDRLIEESRNGENPAATRVKALELLGKVRGVDLFGEKGDGAPPAGSKEIEADIKRKLGELLGGKHWNGALPEGQAE